MIASSDSFLRRLSVRWLVATAVVIGAGLPLLLFSALEVRGITRLREDIGRRSQQAADTLAKESANALKIHAFKAINQTLEDKAIGVNAFFEDVQGSVLQAAEFARGAWTDPSGTSEARLIAADAMRSESARPKDAAMDPVRKCEVSFAAPMLHVPRNAPERAKQATRSRFSKLALPLRSVLKRNPKLILFTYVATPGGMFLSYPADASLAADYDPRSREWYKKAVNNDRRVAAGIQIAAGVGFDGDAVDILADRDRIIARRALDRQRRHQQPGLQRFQVTTERGLAAACGAPRSGRRVPATALSLGRRSANSGYPHHDQLLSVDSHPSLHHRSALGIHVRPPTTLTTSGQTCCKKGLGTGEGFASSPIAKAVSLHKSMTSRAARAAAYPSAPQKETYDPVPLATRRTSHPI